MANFTALIDFTDTKYVGYPLLHKVHCCGDLPNVGGDVFRRASILQSMRIDEVLLLTL